jgi:DNA-binding NarL/FixJ family response regulator
VRRAKETAESSTWSQLTPKEIEILGLLRRGAANKDIAFELKCSLKTVEFHLTNLLRKHDAKSRLELVIKAR